MEHITTDIRILFEFIISFMRNEYFELIMLFAFLGWVYFIFENMQRHQAFKLRNFHIFKHLFTGQSRPRSRSKSD
jgi:hypothetical protein